jgi:hypothetical protein
MQQLLSFVREYRRRYFPASAALFVIAGCGGGGDGVSGGSASGLDVSGGAVIETYNGISYHHQQYFSGVTKYGGGLATYTEMHRPMAIHDAEAGKTFFVYGADDHGVLGIFMGCFNHELGALCSPRRVLRKNGVFDPHDNAALSQDSDGFLWVAVSGRGTIRDGRLFRSLQARSIEHGFIEVASFAFTYPQVWWTPSRGLVLIHTRYSNEREVHVSFDPAGADPGPRLIGGPHYAITHAVGDHIVLAYNDHPGRSVDRRANLSVIESWDAGASWYSLDGQLLWEYGSGRVIPDRDPRSLVLDTESRGRLLYLKDIRSDSNGETAVMYVTSPSADPTDRSQPRCLELARFDREAASWDFETLTCEVAHNYSSGFLSEDLREVVFPLGLTRLNARSGAGGELWRAEKTGEGWAWKQLTFDSCLNHNYPRGVIGQKMSDFEFFWADGDPLRPSGSSLYFWGSDRVNRMPSRWSAC